MQLTKDHVIAAVDAGLAMTDSEQDLLEVYRKHGSGILILRQMLSGIGAGNIVLTSPTPPGPTPEDPPGDDDGDADDD